MTTTFTLSPDQAIEEAIRMAGGQPTQFEELRSARIKLNLLFTDWQNRGINLWKLELVSMPVTSSTVDVSLSTDVIDILDCSWNVSATNTDLMMNRQSYNDYLSLYNKNQPSDRPYQYTVQRLKDQTNLKLWPVNNQSGSLKFWAMKRIEDVNSPRDTLDVPFRYMPALVNGLGYSLFKDRISGTEDDIRKLNVLKADYKEAWDLAFEEDRDRSNFKVIPRKR